MKTTNELQIEAAAERRMDQLDRALMRGELTQEIYDALVRELDTWCTVQYAKLWGRLH